MFSVYRSAATGLVRVTRDHSTAWTPAMKSRRVHQFQLVRSRSSSRVHRVRARGTPIDKRIGGTVFGETLSTDGTEGRHSSPIPPPPHAVSPARGQVTRVSRSRHWDRLPRRIPIDNGRGHGPRLLWRLSHLFLARGSRRITDRPGETSGTTAPGISGGRGGPVAYAGATVLPADSWAATGRYRSPGGSLSAVAPLSTTRIRIIPIYTVVDYGTDPPLPIASLVPSAAKLTRRESKRATGRFLTSYVRRIRIRRKFRGNCRALDDVKISGLPARHIFSFFCDR